MLKNNSLFYVGTYDTVMRMSKSLINNWHIKIMTFLTTKRK